MKILAITDLSGHMVGGPTTAAVELLNGLSQRGHQILLANDHPYPGLNGIAHQRLAPGEGAMVAEQVRRLLLENQPDVVHLLSMGQKTLRLLRRILMDRPWVVTLHSLSPYERIVPAWHRHERVHYALRDLRYLPNTFGWHALLRKLDAPRIIVHSRWMEGVARRYGAPASSLRVVELASTPAMAGMSARLQDATPGPRVVTVAGLAHTKGLHDAIRAIALLRSRFPTIKYCIVGEIRDKSYLKFLEDLIREAGLQNVVEIRERIPAAEKDALLHTADLYVQPSHEEGFCLAYLEAAHRVDRLVGTSTGAMVEISGSDPSMKVVPPRDVRTLASAVECLLQSPDPSNTQFVARQARLTAQFAWARHVDLHQDIYNEIVGMPSTD